MLRMVDKEYIRKKHFVEGWSIHRISRQCEVSRQTVRKCLKDACIPRYTLSRSRPAPVMGKWLPVIEQWLKEDRTRPRKQRHTAKRIHDRLVEEFPGEFIGAESTVRRVVRQLRGQLVRPEAFVPLVSEPGELGQVDFQESKLALVTCDRNRYSVPSNLVGQTVRLDVYSDRIEVYHRSALVARHTRLTGRGGMATDFRHYLDVVAFKRRTSMEAAFVDGMPAVYKTAREKLRLRDRGYREFAGILALNREWPAEAVETALAKAIEADRLTVEAVRQLILADFTPQRVPVTVPAAIAVTLTPPNLRRYDRLAKGAAGS